MRTKKSVVGLVLLVFSTLVGRSAQKLLTVPVSNKQYENMLLPRSVKGKSNSRSGNRLFWDTKIKRVSLSIDMNLSKQRSYMKS